MNARAPFEVGMPSTDALAHERLARSFGLGRALTPNGVEGEPFVFQGRALRVLDVDGEPWFVASDVARFLGYRDASDLTRSLDDDEKGSELVRTPGGPQLMNVVNEHGLYRGVMKREVGFVAESDRIAVKNFQRWVTHEVLPSIRRTGQYVAHAAPVLPQSYAEALRELAASVEAREALAAEVSTLTPRAEAWDELASAEGDYSVADAANILKRAGVDTGPQRLFDTLGEIRWTYRGEGRRWRPYARALDDGYLTERAMPPRLNSEGELVPTAPQVRVTARGLERLRIRLGVISTEVTR